jgi:phosphatidate cytidylyltransferase
MKKEFEKRIISSLIVIPIALFFIIKGSVFFTFFLGIFFLATSYEWIKMNKKKSVKFLGLLYLLIAFYSAYLLRELYGFKIFLFIIIVCIFTDLGGYIFGKLFKGPKLTKISPNKTYSGVLGGFILSVITGSIFSQKIYSASEAFGSIFLYVDYNIHPHTTLLLLILIISSVSQIGDLIISYFKRLAKVKDTGKILPGHGGLLDRIDGIIFVIPISYLLINFFN